MGMKQTEETKICVLARLKIPKYGHWPDRKDQKQEFCPDQTDQKMGIN